MIFYFFDRGFLLFILVVLINMMFAGSVFGNAPQELKREIAVAREDLRRSEAEESRILSELKEMERTGNVSEESMNEYKRYLDRVRAMKEEHRKLLVDLESLDGRHQGESSAMHTGSDKASGNMLNPDIPEEQVTDEVDALDRKLNNSLAEFDAMLLKEVERIKQRSAERVRDLSQEVADAVSRLKEKGIDLEAQGESGSSSEGREASGEESQASQEAEGSGEGTREDVRKGQKAGRNGDVQNGNDRANEDEGSQGTRGSKIGKKKSYNFGDDDDIVARQLREAAERETDPELKKRLWEEYEEYKRK